MISEKRLIIVLLVCLVAMASCSRKFLVQEANPMATENVIRTDNRIDIKTFYGGDMGSYITFQVDIDNRSDSLLFIYDADVEFLLNDGQANSLRLKPIKKSRILDDLYYEEERVDQEKKASTIFNVIATGLGIVTGVVAGGAGVDAIFYGSDAVTGIVGDRRSYNAYQGSIQEMIAYHKEYTLDEIEIKPGRSASFDVHFKKLMIEAPGVLKLRCHDTELEFPYELFIQEVTE